jgi:hypothetical protein
VRRALPLVLLTPLLVPAAAHAAPALEVHVTDQSVRYGRSHEVTGTLLDGTTPLAGQAVVLEGQRYPYQGSFRTIERATTDASGAFAFKPELDRNHHLQVVAPLQGLTSQKLTVFTLPSFSLSFHAIRPGVVRLYQRYTVPRSVHLKEPTLFYLGKHGAKQASLRVSGKVKRTSAGHYTSMTTVTLPMSWKGEFRFGTCFRTSTGSGMGDPAATCPKKHLRF